MAGGAVKRCLAWPIVSWCYLPYERKPRGCTCLIHSKKASMAQRRIPAVDQAEQAEQPDDNQDPPAFARNPA